MRLLDQFNDAQDGGDRKSERINHPLVLVPYHVRNRQITHCQHPEGYSNKKMSHTSVGAVVASSDAASPASVTG